MGILTAGRHRITTWMPTKPPSARQWPDEYTDSGPTKCQSNPAAARQRADRHSDIGPSSGFQHQPDVGNAWQIDQQLDNTHRPSSHLTDAVLLTLGRYCADIGLIHLCKHPCDVALPATMSFQCIADEELTSSRWQWPATTMKYGPQYKKIKKKWRLIAQTVHMCNATGLLYTLLSTYLL